jgi:hypothetical protein
MPANNKNRNPLRLRFFSGIGCFPSGNSGRLKGLKSVEEFSSPKEIVFVEPISQPLIDDFPQCHERAGQGHEPFESIHGFLVPRHHAAVTVQPGVAPLHLPPTLQPTLPTRVRRPRLHPVRTMLRHQHQTPTLQPQPQVVAVVAPVAQHRNRLTRLPRQRHQHHRQHRQAQPHLRGVGRIHRDRDAVRVREQFDLVA